MMLTLCCSTRLIVFFLLVGFTQCFAEYKIILKNGREVYVDDYREDGPWIRATILGGEVGFPKKSLSGIEKAAETPHPTPTVMISPAGPQKPTEETGQDVTGLDREIRKAQEEFLEARSRGAGDEEIRQKELNWNRLRLHRFQLIRKLNEREKIPPVNQ